ncbi:MAG: arsenate reductase ArsC [Agarilytica sp.]
MKILYICTHNRCRSILSEAITNHLSNGRLQAFSAGSLPAGQVHPLTLKYLEEKGIPTGGLESESWNMYETERPDIVVTVCDSAANEVCPVWFGDTLKIHWGLRDPSKLTGDEEEIRQAFFEVMDTIEQRIKKMLSLNLDRVDKEEQWALLQKLAKE